MAATVTVIVSPSNQMDTDTADPAINNHLADMMQGNQNYNKTKEEKE